LERGFFWELRALEQDPNGKLFAYVEGLISKARAVSLPEIRATNFRGQIVDLRKVVESRPFTFIIGTSKRHMCNVFSLSLSLPSLLSLYLHCQHCSDYPCRRWSKVGNFL
jgi:hypothetical protein